MPPAPPTFEARDGIRSPPCAMTMVGRPVTPGTTPPAWKVGRFGTLMLLPPMIGTHPGTDQDSRPIVLFQARAIMLNAVRNGRLTKSATLRKAVPIQPGVFFMKSHVFDAADRIHFHEARHAVENQSVFLAISTMTAIKATMPTTIQVIGEASRAVFMIHCAAAAALVAADVTPVCTACAADASLKLLAANTPRSITPVKPVTMADADSILAPNSPIAVFSPKASVSAPPTSPMPPDSSELCEDRWSNRSAL